MVARHCCFCTYIKAAIQKYEREEKKGWEESKGNTSNPASYRKREGQGQSKQKQRTDNDNEFSHLTQ